jgi:hypothetical protein
MLTLELYEEGTHEEIYMVIQLLCYNVWSTIIVLQWSYNYCATMLNVECVLQLYGHTITRPWLDAEILPCGAHAPKHATVGFRFEICASQLVYYLYSVLEYFLETVFKSDTINFFVSLVSHTTHPSPTCVTHFLSPIFLSQTPPPPAVLIDSLRPPPILFHSLSFWTKS